MMILGKLSDVEVSSLRDVLGPGWYQLSSKPPKPLCTLVLTMNSLLAITGMCAKDFQEEFKRIEKERRKR